MVRQSCLKNMDIDLLALAETHLISNKGVGLLIENTFASNYNIQILDKGHEGILWINFKHILNGT